MKNKDRIVLLGFSLICVLGFAFFSYKNNTLASAYDESGLVVSGSHSVVSSAEVNEGKNAKVTFTFKTTDPNYRGFICGGYVLKYDPSRMSIPASSINHSKGLGGVNPDYTTFTVNNAPAEKGMILVTFGSTVPGQNYDLTFEVADLFKDGTREPLQIELINRAEDPLTVFDINDRFYAPSSPIIKNATITITDLSIRVEGVDKIVKGNESTYKATVTNSLGNNLVTWGVKGAKSSKTSIDSSGKLSVGSDETASFIEVVATSQESPNIFASKKVEITSPAKVTVSIQGDSQIIKGTKGNKYTAILTNVTDSNVIWSIKGQTSSLTSINENGEVTVGIDEQSSSIEVIAISKEDKTVLESKTIKLIDKTYTITNIQLPYTDMKMNTTMSKEDLIKELNKNSKAKVTISTNDKKSFTLDVDIVDYKLLEEMLTKNNMLNEGKYNVKCLIDLPAIEVDHNNKLTYKDGDTNIIGENSKSVVVEVIKKVIAPAENTSKDKNQSSMNESSTNQNVGKYVAVRTLDDSHVLGYMNSLVGAFVVFVYAKLKKEQV